MRPCVLAFAAMAFPLCPALGQQPDARKHFSIDSPKGWRVAMSAENMAREGSVLHLRGKVEIKTSQQPSEHGMYLLVRADAADFHIDTGAVEPRGNVKLEPQPDPK